MEYLSMASISAGLLELRIGAIAGWRGLVGGLLDQVEALPAARDISLVGDAHRH